MPMSGVISRSANPAFRAADKVVEFGSHPELLVRTGNENPTALTVSGALLREHPDLVARYLKRLLLAARWAEDHPREAAQIVASDVAAPLDWVEPAYGPELHTKFAPDLRDDWIAGLESQKDFLLKWGFIERDFDIREWIDPKPLEMARAAL